MNRIVTVPSALARQRARGEIAQHPALLPGLCGRKGRHLIPIVAVLSAMACSNHGGPAEGLDVFDREAKEPDPTTATFDIVVVGAGTGGVAAAVQAARMGRRVALLERTDYIGGQIAAAVGGMDDYHLEFPQTNTGLEEELGNRVKQYYETEAPFAPKAVNTGGLGGWPRNMEPSVGRLLMRRMLDEASVELHTGVGVKSVMMSGNAVAGVVLADDRRFVAKVVIDATEHGDVIPLTPARYYVGNSTSDSIDEQACMQDLTYVAVIRKYPDAVPPDLVVSAPLPGYSDEKPMFEAMVRNSGSDNWRPFPWSWVTHIAYRGFPDSTNPVSYTGAKPDRGKITRTALNFANDYPGNGHLDPAKTLKVTYLTDPEARREIDCGAKVRTLNFLYYIQKELGRTSWSVANDEGYDTDFNREHNRCDNIPAALKEIEAYLPQQPYVRESIRIVPIAPLTAKGIKKGRIDGESSASAIAVGSYFTDLHNCKKASDLDLGDTPDDFQKRGPFQVPLEALIPESVDGLLAAEKNIGVSRLANGSTRLHGITIATGQAAGAVAALAVAKGVAPRQLRAVDVQWALLESDSALSLRNFEDVPRTSTFWKSVQLANTHGILNGYSTSRFGFADPFTRAQAAVVVARLLDLDISSPPESPTFSDVSTNHWAFAHIEAIRDAGITHGCSSSAFCPEQQVTRAHLAAFVARALGLTSPSADPVFADVSTANPFFDSIQLMAQEGIMTGCSSAPRRFCPDDPATRGQAAAVAARVLLR
jgi:hypothetical protein